MDTHCPFLFLSLLPPYFICFLPFTHIPSPSIIWSIGNTPPHPLNMPSIPHFSAPLSLNVPEKSRSVMAEAHRLKAHIIFFQETHFKTGAVQCLATKRFPEVYHATCAGSKTKGVAILIAKSLTFRLKDHVAHLEGRIFFLKEFWKDRPVTLANIYCPNSKQVSFLKDPLLKLASFRAGLLILGGDFNMALDPILDTSTGTSSLPFASLKGAKLELASLTLISTWRTLNPPGKGLHVLLVHTQPVFKA